MRRRGVEVSDAVEGGRRTPAGRELRWRAARLTDAVNPLPIFFLEHLTPLEERRPPEARVGHPNGVLGTDPRLHRRARRRGGGARVWPGARAAGSQDPARQRDQGGHGGVQPGADGPRGGAARRAGTGRGGPGPLRARAIPGPLSHEWHGGGGAVDGGPWPARRRRAASATRARRRCWWRRSTPAAPISASSGQSRRRRRRSPPIGLLGACRRNPARAMRRVQLRGGARRQPARRTFCTLSRLSRAPTKQMGPYHRSSARSMLHTPAPRLAMYRNTKQKSTASSPPFWIGQKPRGSVR